MRENLNKLSSSERMIHLKQCLKYGEWVSDYDAKRVRWEFRKLKERLCPLKKAKCFTCGAKAEHRHHILPISRGGKNTKNNLVPLCIVCHNKLDVIKAQKSNNKKPKFIPRVIIAPKNYKNPFSNREGQILVV